MSYTAKNWSFLPEAWKYALVLTGREADATAMVSDALKTLSKRFDLWDAGRIRRLLFSTLYQRGAKIPRVETAGTPAENQVLAFHQLEEPGRSALTLLYLGSFSGEHLATLLEQSESACAGILLAARVALVEKLALLA